MNKIETISRASLGWLAGLIDGEGWISIGCYKNGFRKDGIQKYAFYIRIGITNTNAACLEKATEILSALNVQFKVNVRKRKNIKRKPCADILVYSQAQAVKLIDILYPYLTNKKDLAFQARLFYNYLLEIKGAIGNNQHEQSRSPKIDSEILNTFIKRFRELSQWRPDLFKYSRKANEPMKLKRPSETTKPTPIFYGDGIVQTI